jgi:hypothetical protein
MTEFSDSGLRYSVIDINKFVNQVADRFERSRHGTVRISLAARRELVNNMEPHEKQLRIDLASGKMTTDELMKILRKVLSAAVKRPWKPERSRFKEKAARYKHLEMGFQSYRIDRRGIQMAMRRTCRYLGWC